MAHRASRRRHSHEVGDDLNLTPMIDIFIMLIFFLLLTAVFAKTAIIDTYLPKDDQGAATGRGGPVEVLAIKITEKGFDLSGIGAGTFIPKNRSGLNYQELTDSLAAIKQRYPRKEDVILLFDPDVSYDTVVKVMDAARETSDSAKRPLFPQVSLGENR